MPPRIKYPGNNLKNILGIPFCIFFFVISATSTAQRRALTYDVIRNGNKVGSIYFSESSSGKTDSLRLETTIRTKFISTFVVTAKEHAVFNNGILSESAIYRQLNGKEKANKKHKSDNGKYVISGGKNSAGIKIYPITYNMLSLYSKEPIDIRKVYSDNFESLLDIEKTEDHKYKIALPDDSHNFYIYKEGVLNQVEVHHSLYSAKFVLVNK
jgi:hypothetical protein